MSEPKQPAVCRECAFKSGFGKVRCGCSRCESIRANGFCSPHCEKNYNEVKAYLLERERRTA